MFPRTPAKLADDMDKEKSPPRTQTLSSGMGRSTEKPKSPPKTQTLSSNVRRSVEKLEATGSEPQNLTPATSKIDIPILPRQVISNRLAVAKANVIKAKTNINNSRNIKTDIKTSVLEAVDKLFQLVKEADTEIKRLKKTGETSTSETTDNSQVILKKTPPRETSESHSLILAQLKEQSRLLATNGTKIDELKEKMEQQHQLLSSKTYAEATESRPTMHSSPKSALHSVVVTSQDEEDSGEQVLKKVREAVNAKEGWIRVERTRKGRDRKVIMSCNTAEDRQKVKERIENAGKNLVVEEVQNRDPLLRLADVLSANTDEEVLKAFRNQNRGIFHDLKDKDDRMEIKYKRKARNPHTSHIVLSVSPAIWKRATEAGAVYIDLQRIRVFDQSPLVQCSRCLGYGHSKRFCTDPADLCSHCGGLHLRTQCPEWLAGGEPSCRNCVLGKLGRNDHNAFSTECPIRRKRDAIARMSIAYC